MKSTLNTDVPEYIGADLTDRYAKGCRPIDVCGLSSFDAKLRASFWCWDWDPTGRDLDVHAISSELRSARGSMLDGPQGLAARGCAIRTCERQSAAVGKTGDAPPSPGRPFAGFIRSSLELFTALRRGGLEVSPSNCLGGVCEVYPGHIWTILSDRRGLPNKSTHQGRIARKRMLEAFGVVGLPHLPTHDQNDACVAALLAAAADGKVRGMSVKVIGAPLFVDSDGTLREGFMVIPELASEVQAAVHDHLAEVPTIDLVAADPGKQRATPNSSAAERADALLNYLILRATDGKPQVCTYSWAYKHLFDSATKWSPACVSPLLTVAQRTLPLELRGLGTVRLDAFLVAKADGCPGDGHWKSARYDPEDWARVLGAAVVID